MISSSKPETRLQHAVTTYIVTGLTLVLLPGTFLGVWNLISISSRQTLESLSAAWLQAHGHAQIYGWIGTFILGIGFYSLSKMGRLPAFAVRRAWICYALWTTGVVLRWIANVTAWQWRVALPVSALLELAGFLVFFATVSGHKSAPVAPRKPKEPWMLVVIGATVGFLLALIANAVVAFQTALSAATPSVEQATDLRLLILPVWGFLAPTVWGFNARWLPVFLGLRAPEGNRLLTALGVVWAGVISGLLGHPLLAAVLALSASVIAILALHIYESPERPPKTSGVHPSFPVFVRLAYVWLLVAGSLTIWAAAADHGGGIAGASRHAITVGFLGAMVFAIGQRILPAFCGAKLLFSKKLMLCSLVLLNIGCTLRVCSEIPAYEGFALASFFWHVLPVSAVIELAAVTLFAVNLAATFVRPPAHLMNPLPEQPSLVTVRPGTARR